MSTLESDPLVPELEPKEALRITNLSSGYGALTILHNVNLSADWRSVTAMIGLNGAGKTTFARSISGMTDVRQGTIIFDGHNVTSYRPSAIARLGVLHVFEDRELFTNLTVAENLVLGFFGAHHRITEERSAVLDEIYSLLPKLALRRKQVTGTLSGGEQQMVALGRSLAGRPRFLILDEPSTGLAPVLVDEIYEALNKLRETGLPMLVIEQDIERALAFADYVYVLTSGTITLEGRSDEVGNHSEISDLLFSG